MGTAHLRPVRELLCGCPPGSSTIHLGARGQGKGCVPGSSQDSYQEALRVAEPIVSLRPDRPEPHAWTPCPRVYHFPPRSMSYTVSCHVSCLLYPVLLCPILYCCFTPCPTVSCHCPELLGNCFPSPRKQAEPRPSLPLAARAPRGPSVPTF